MISASSQVKDGKEGGGLSGAGQHCSSAPLQSCDLGSNQIIGGILKPCIEITRRLQIKQLAHVFAGVVLESRTLDDRDHPGLTIFGFITGLDAHCITFHFNTCPF